MSALDAVAVAAFTALALQRGATDEEAIAAWPLMRNTPIWDDPASIIHLVDRAISRVRSAPLTPGVTE